MTDWFSISLGDGILAATPLARIESAFTAQAQHPDAAVFVRYATQGDLHCEVTVYFSPAAAELAHHFGATPCPRPAAKNLDLLAGDPGCRERLL